jgi:hypothetical protein
VGPKSIRLDAYFLKKAEIGAWYAQEKKTNGQIE